MYSNAQHQQNYNGGRENPPLNNININPGYAQQLQHQHQLQNNMSSSRSHINRSVVDLHPNVLIFLDSIIDRVNFTHKNQSESGGIVALLMGTIDGVGLVRAFGTSNTVDAGLSEIELSIIESVWATFPSGTGHHLRSLGLGQDCKMITTFYENSTLVHFHMSPLIVTFLTTSDTNVGAIHAVLPELLNFLRPMRRAIFMGAPSKNSGNNNSGSSRFSNS